MSMKLQLGRRLHATFCTGRIQSCCWYLTPNKKLIFNELIWHFMYSYLRVFLDVTYRHKLNHSLLGVPRKLVFLKFENKEKWVISMKSSGNWIIMFLFTIPYEVVCKHFGYFLGTANLRNNSLLSRTLSMVYTIPCQRIFVPNLIFIGLVLERKIATMNLFTKSEKWKIKKDSLLNKVAWGALSYSLPK